MKNLGITTKIWLSIGVFVLGFVFSIVLGQIQSRTTERSLRNAAEAQFPAAQQSQDAAFAFERAVKGFGDAVVVQDASALQASEDGGSAAQSLRLAAATKGLSPARQQQLSELADGVQSLVNDAKTTYTAVLANPQNMTPDTQDKMQKLASRTNTLKASLQDLKQSLSQDLQGQLSVSRFASETQRWVSASVCVLTIALAWIIVTLTIRRSITGPIVRVIEGVQRAADDASAASSEMSQSGQVVAKDAQQQALYIEETSASLEEISGTTWENAGRGRASGRTDARSRN